MSIPESSGSDSMPHQTGSERLLFPDRQEELPESLRGIPESTLADIERTIAELLDTNNKTANPLTHEQRKFILAFAVFLKGIKDPPKLSNGFAAATHIVLKDRKIAIQTHDVGRLEEWQTGPEGRLYDDLNRKRKSMPPEKFDAYINRLRTRTNQLLFKDATPPSESSVSMSPEEENISPAATLDCLMKSEEWEIAGQRATGFLKDTNVIKTTADFVLCAAALLHAASQPGPLAVRTRLQYAKDAQATFAMALEMLKTETEEKMRPGIARRLENLRKLIVQLEKAVAALGKRKEDAA